MSIFCVDRDLCTRCGACSGVCPQGIIDPAEEPAFPGVADEKSPLCIMCGQCVAACPTGAASLSIDQGAGYKPVIDEHAIDPEVLGTYIRSRRSVRKYRPEPVDRETITKILDVARWAASGGNGQPVEWLVIHDPAKVKKIAGLTVDWLRSLAKTDHPMAAFAPLLVSAWESGADPISREAPHLLIPHISTNQPIAPVDAIIALTHVDVVAPAYGVGTCWAGFVAMAAHVYPPLQQALGLPEGRVAAYVMMLGYPQYKLYRIPSRKPLAVTWQ